MPLYKSLVLNSQTIVKIWKISESKDFFSGQLVLKPESLERVNSMKSELHQRGFLSVRMLLAEFGYVDEDLVYDAFGKPHLKDGKHISITHSYTFSAVVVSSRPVGVDIEKQREKIIKIASKFIGYEDSYLTEKDPKLIQKLTWIWCIKESLSDTLQPVSRLPRTLRNARAACPHPRRGRSTSNVRKDRNKFRTARRGSH